MDNTGSTSYAKIAPNSPVSSLTPTVANGKRYCVVTALKATTVNVNDFLKIFLLEGSGCALGFRCEAGGYLTAYN
jgi:hypothetical protein